MPPESSAVPPESTNVSQTRPKPLLLLIGAVLLAATFFLLTQPSGSTPFQKTGIPMLEYQWLKSKKAIRLHSGDAYCIFSPTLNISCEIPVVVTFEADGVHLQLKQDAVVLPYLPSTSK